MPIVMARSMSMVIVAGFISLRMIDLYLLTIQIDLSYRLIGVYVYIRTDHFGTDDFVPT